MPLDQKPREELRIRGSTNFESFLGGGANGGGFEDKNPRLKKCLFYVTNYLKKGSTFLFKYCFKSESPLKIISSTAFELCYLRTTWEHVTYVISCSNKTTTQEDCKWKSSL